MKTVKTVKIDDVEYVPKDTLPEISDKEISMVRTYSAGVFFGHIAKRNGKEATLLNARRVYYWAGAASLSQLATEGTVAPENCKFPCAVPKVILTEVIEIIPMTDKAIESLNGVKIWELK